MAWYVVGVSMAANEGVAVRDQRQQTANRGTQVRREDARLRHARGSDLPAQLRGVAGCMMGRRRESNFDDPPRFHRKGNVWYHVSGTLPRVWTKLSSDRAEALRLWAQREGVREDESTRLFAVVARRYIREVLPTKAPAMRLGIEITGELAAVIARINERPTKTGSDFLIRNENGQPLTRDALRSRFDKAREEAGVSFQFRDIRAKAATDTGDLAHSQKLLAHKNRQMTERYVRARIGERIKPLR